MLIDTKIVLKLTQWTIFSPFGRKLKPLIYRSSVLSDSIIIFGKTDSIPNYTIDVLQGGRALLRQLKKKTIITSLYIQYICHPVTILIVYTLYTLQ